MLSPFLKDVEGSARETVTSCYSYVDSHIGSQMILIETYPINKLEREYC